MSETSSSLLARLPKVRGSYREKVSLARFTWFQVGGEADVVFRPEDSADLAFFLAQIPKDIPLMILGVGSNLLVRDAGIAGVVIRLGKGFTEVKFSGNLIEAGSAALCYNVSQLVLSKSLSGLEFWSGIPGTVGGALSMNAGAYGSETADRLEAAEAIDESGSIHQLKPSDIGYVYRGHTMPEKMFFTRGWWRLTEKSQAEISTAMNAIRDARVDSQPIRSRTGGSTFKNPAGKKAWQLIDSAGCRGLKNGDAQISNQHCNFLINNGNATATEIEALINEVQRRVYEHSSVMLEVEIKCVGRQKNE